MNADGIIIAATNEAIAPYLDMCQVPVVAIDSVLDTQKSESFLLCDYDVHAGLPIPEILRMSAKASSIAVSREGAVPSIPYRAEAEEALKAYNTHKMTAPRKWGVIFAPAGHVYKT